MDEAQLHQRIRELESQLAQKDARINWLQEQFRLAQQKAFGASSEGHPGQGELFDEAESVVAEPETKSTQVGSHVRNKPVRKPLPKSLPRETVVLDLAEDEKICDCCQGQLHKIGEDTAEKLEFIPAQVKVIETIRPKYACRACDKDGTTGQIKQTPPAPAIIPKGIATPSLLSQIVTSKYQYGLPLYRQESMFSQYGIELSRKTMADWMIRCAQSLEIIYVLLRQILLQQAVIQADETTLKVVKEDKNTCYMWLYCTGSDSPVPDSPIPNIVLYDYQRSRSGQCAVEFLDGFSQFLQVDGYQGYEQTQATLVGCMAHARRKFMEAKQSQVKGKSGKADMALNQIQQLYAIERRITDKTPEEKQAIRLEKAVPLLTKFRTWLEKSSLQVPPKSKMGDAVNYSLNQWEKLIHYTQDGRLSIDNNRAERAIKPFVIGRKNWLFSNTASGAKASATLYSIIETAKANDLVPFDYLKMLFEELPKRKSDHDLSDLLPWEILPNETTPV
ncbi:MAG: IS66 family transposase [Aestuariibacter sp.]